MGKGKVRQSRRQAERLRRRARAGEDTHRGRCGSAGYHQNDTGAAPSARASAASSVLDRAWGRPEISVSASVGETYADVLRRINQEEDAAEVESLPEKVLLAPING